MHRGQEDKDRARIWRGLAVWPLVVGAVVAFTALVVRPKDLGPTLTVVGTAAGFAMVTAVVVGCIGVARTSDSRLERRLFAVASGVILGLLGLVVLVIVGIAVAMCGASASGC